MQCDIDVYLEGGIYRITSPLRFGSHDSGGNGHKVIWRNYPGESPVISGGTSITGWSKAPNGVWSASTKGYDFLQLYLPHGRISPARTPTFRGRLYSVPGSDTVQVKVASDVLTKWNIHPVDLVQVVFQYTWRQLRYRIASISPDENGYRWIIAKKPDGTVSPNAGSGHKCCSPDGTNPIGTTLHPISFGKSPVFLEYTKQYLAANSFWLNTADDKVQWLPEPGVKPNDLRVIAPTTKRLVIIDEASNLIFYGLQFAYTPVRLQRK